MIRKIATICAARKEPGDTLQFVSSNHFERKVKKGESVFSAPDGMFIHNLLPGLTWKEGKKRVELAITIGPAPGAVKVWCFGKTDYRQLTALEKPELTPLMSINLKDDTFIPEQRSWSVTGGALAIFPFDRSPVLPGLTEEEAFPLYISVRSVFQPEFKPGDRIRLRQQHVKDFFESIAAGRKEQILTIGSFDGCDYWTKPYSWGIPIEDQSKYELINS